MIIAPLETLCAEFSDGRCARSKGSQSSFDSTIIHTDIVDCVATVSLALNDLPLLAIGGSEQTRVRRLPAAFWEYDGIMKRYENNGIGWKIRSDDCLFPFLSGFRRRRLI